MSYSNEWNMHSAARRWGILYRSVAGWFASVPRVEAGVYRREAAERFLTRGRRDGLVSHE
jgi:hypothetical protein